MTIFHKLLNQIGLDKTVFYSIALRGWQLMAGPITLLLIAHFFTPVQQGFYYTFNSILTMQMFFEMGLSFVIVQFVSHEFAHLRWGKLGRISGGAKIKRFKELVVKSFRWYFIVSLFFLAIILPWGIYFFGLKDHGQLTFSWRIPWCFLVIATMINLMLTPLLAIMEGGGKIQSLYRIRFTQSIVGTLLSWITIIAGYGLFNAVCVAFAANCISSFWLYRHNKILLRIATKFKQFKKITQQNLFSWNNEVWPMQWRIAVSWISGYFIYQITVPLLFYYQGAVTAGQMGMSLTLTSTLTLIGQAWLNAKAPSFGNLVAVKDWIGLDHLFHKTFWQSTCVVLMGVVGLTAVVYLFRNYSLMHRLLPPAQVFFLALSALLNHLINCMAQYLRSHKKEPFMILSVIAAILFGSACWICTKYYSSEILVIALFLINLIYGAPSSFVIWLRSKRAWH